MILRHLRRNAVAYLALFVALGGTSYAAVNLPKNSVGTKQIKKNAVTSAKLKKNAVNSTKVKDGTLLASDLRADQLPKAAWGDALVRNGDDPVADPDGTLALTYTFTVPRSGPVLLELSAPDRNRSCTVGFAFTGMYLDGKPVPGTGVGLPVPGGDPVPFSSVATVNVAKGTHTVGVRDDCPLGLLNVGTSVSTGTWTAVALGSTS
ncbi:hypothetical protein [Nocardioides sp. SYSU D00038]|uniref:hypothetical protein n=1 Tax=Nocardioides sp. SYSU D00038 TaxID=2812554 RepID=UPI0019678AD7|nr:hypothetical protein [Nocardioides sp. SYSU D00038]